MLNPRFVKSVVNTCLRIRKGDRVSIFAWRHMLDLAEAFAIECRRAGAKIHTEFGSDRLFYDSALNLPLDFIKETDPFSLALLEVTTANIFISGPEDPEKLRLITPDRASAMGRADKPYYDRFLEKEIRSAHISLGYVTRPRAKTYGFDYEEWKENINAAMDVKYEHMQRLGKKIASALEKASDAHITTPSGTDLTLNIGGRVTHIDDGVIDEDDINNGALFTNLPAGSVALAPLETSANGAFVSDVPQPYYGVLIDGAAWNFKDGAIVSFKGKRNIDAVKTKWKDATGDKDRIGWLTLGLNPRAKLGFIDNSIVLGTVTIGVGDNREIGGKNASDFGVKFTATEPTFEVDGKPILKHGKLVL